MENRALILGEEFGIHPVIIATGDEWRRPDLALSKHHAYISPLLFPALSKLPEEEDWEQISLDQLRAWDHAPGNPSLISKNSQSLSFTTSGVGLGEFHENLLKAVDRGLPEEKALAALTINPARICGIEQFTGTLEKGKMANLVVVEGDTYFDKKTQISSTWIRGRPFEYPVKDAGDEDGAEEANATEEKEPEKRTARFPHDDRKVIETPGSTLFTGFKLWTCTGKGILSDHDLLVRDGKIFAIGPNLKARLPRIARSSRAKACT